MVERLESDFDVRMIDDFVIIIDLNLGRKSVTNDIENIIQHIHKYVDLKGKTVIYRDSFYQYDQVVLNDRFKFHRFQKITPIREIFDLYDAIVICTDE